MLKVDLPQKLCQNCLIYFRPICSHVVDLARSWSTTLPSLIPKANLSSILWFCLPIEIERGKPWQLRTLENLRSANEECLKTVVFSLPKTLTVNDITSGSRNCMEVKLCDSRFKIKIEWGHECQNLLKFIAPLDSSLKDYVRSVDKGIKTMQLPSNRAPQVNFNPIFMRLLRFGGRKTCKICCKENENSYI